MTTGAQATKTSISKDGQTATVSIPVTFLQRGGRKQIVVPPGAADWQPRANRCENSLINALAKAHLWRRLIETGKYTSAAELSRAEAINEPYLCRVLRLAKQKLDSPEIAGAPVNQGCIRASERMRSEKSWVQPNVSIGVENCMPNDSRRGKIP